MELECQIPNLLHESNKALQDYLPTMQTNELKMNEIEFLHLRTFCGA